ncbi:universal stress protein [Glaciihabitans sp. dw_435]|uniref:universal stress protein n=1 Tax=Glaciihabitans sp. dw_435 TaxID=2720081 RepID=UPI001BD1DC13|nr:universal stress protein [Glaciihabitans sp. dw_435]
MSAPSGPAILAAYKGDAGADVLAFASAWSRSSGRPLTVVTVYPGAAPIGMGRVDSEWVAYNREQAQLLLAEARTALGQTDATFQSIAADSASHGLNDALESAVAGSIMVLGSRKTRGTRRTAPGSTADRLLQGAPGPVAIVPWAYDEYAATTIRRVAVAFIDTPDGAAALQTGSRLAREVGAELQLLSVLPDTLVRPSLGEPTSFASEQRAQFQSAVDAAARENAATAVLLDGPVVDTLADLKPDDFDLLVCGSRGYGPARRVLLGGVSSRLLKHSRVPVMVVPRN